MGLDAVPPRKKNTSSLIRTYFLIAFVVWAAVIAALFIWDAYQARSFALRDAQSNALANYNKDVAFREWAATHGGVYVPVDEATPPNPYLANIRERDIITPSGRHLTLMNPAYMARQLNEYFAKHGNIFGHITSLNLRNPINKPDKWEEDALRAFERGEKERVEVADIDGQPFLRLMRPLITREGCLKCHADQGYKVGDIRGGVSVSVALAPYYAEAREISGKHIIMFCLIWLFGLLGLLVGYRFSRNLERVRDEAKEALLAFSELKLDKALALGRIGHWEYDPATGQTRWSNIMYEIFSRDPRRGPLSLREEEGYYTPEQWGDLRGYMRRAMEEGITLSYDLEAVIPGRGVIFLAGTVTSFQPGESGPKKLFGVMQDITELKSNERKLKAANLELNVALKQLRRTQADLVRSEKMAAVGTLSAGVAHEILNPLNIIGAIVQLMQMDEWPAKVKENLGQIMAQVRRAAKITDNLSKFAHQRKPERASVDIQAVFNRTAGLLENGLHHDNIRIDRDFATDLSAIFADEGQIAEVFLNLMVNAREAIRGRAGVIAVKARNLGKGVEIRFSDNGPGIPAEIIGRIFDPFFTTKDPGQGTGLGLSMVHTIIEEQKGTITVESEAGRGTTFIIYLPASATGNNNA